MPFSPATPRLVPRVVRRLPHDTTAFTQGLLVHDGRLLESTGLEGHSGVREVESATGRVLRRAELPSEEFGEGIAVIGDRIYQLTWKSHRGLVYDARTLAPVDSFTYDGEGWGLTTDGSLLYLSDGTSRIRVIDPERLSRRAHDPRDGSGAAGAHAQRARMGEGRAVGERVLDRLIARIDPASGRIVGWIDVRRLLPDAREQAARGRAVAWRTESRTIPRPRSCW